MLSIVDDTHNSLVDSYHNERINLVMLYYQQLRNMKFKLVNVPTGRKMEHTQSLTTAHSGDLR